MAAFRKINKGFSKNMFCHERLCFYFHDKKNNLAILEKTKEGIPMQKG